MSEVSNTPSKRELGENYRQQMREERGRRRSQRHRELRCFWTWPFGHVYEDMWKINRCINCGWHGGNAEW